MSNTFERLSLTRRQFLAGAAAFVTAARRGEAQSVDVTPRGTARTCIFLNLVGGPSHLDTFDIKDASWNPPDARIEQFASGITLDTTLFPQLGRHASDLLYIRSVRSWEAAHERGQFYLQTAHPANPAFQAETPHIGAVVSLELNRPGPLPPFVSFNGEVRGATFLGGSFEPFAPPVQPEGLQIVRHDYYDEASQQRFEDKFKLLQELDASIRANPPDPMLSAHGAFYDSAKQLMHNDTITSVFQFSSDDDRRYGGSQLGRACIVARNAIQLDAGAAFISAQHFNWDTHNAQFDRGGFPNLYMLCSELDTALTSLVDDLKIAGKLDETLIVVMGEFGRTPGALNTVAGRDHHKDAQTALLLGGGVRGGRVIGATDARGDQITDPGWSGNREIYTEDLTATIYSALGINWTKSITDTPSGRRFEYVPSADRGVYTSVDEVFG